MYVFHCIDDLNDIRSRSLNFVKCGNFYYPSMNLKTYFFIHFSNTLKKTIYMHIENILQLIYVVNTISNCV